MSDLPKVHVLVITATNHEYKAACRHCRNQEFKNLHVSVRLCGPGKINAAYTLAQASQELSDEGEAPSLVIGAGTCGALDYNLKSGDIIFSTASIISDYRMQDKDGFHNAAYGTLHFTHPSAFRPETIRIECRAPLMDALGKHMAEKHCLTGTLLTSDTFIAGSEDRLKHGEQYAALACDMESGAFAYIAEDKLKLPWCNLRIVADTLNENFAHYALMEEEMTELLGGRLAVLLMALDELV